MMGPLRSCILSYVSWNFSGYWYKPHYQMMTAIYLWCSWLNLGLMSVTLNIPFSWYFCCSVALSVLNHCCFNVSLHISSWVCVRLGHLYRCTCAVWVCLDGHKNIHRLGGFSNRHLFPHSSGDYSSEIRVLAWLGLVRTLFLACGWSPCHCVLIRQRYIGSKIFDVSCYKGTNSIMRDPPSWPHLT